jgi:hypothetical protein
MGVLVGFAGEALTLNGVETVQAIVNRKPLELKDTITAKDGELNFQADGLTEIEIRFVDILEQPTVGDAFLDSLGFRHRVKYVFPTAITWVCYCERSQPS